MHDVRGGGGAWIGIGTKYSFKHFGNSCRGAKIIIMFLVVLSALAAMKINS
jgi:hypothetical protein